MKRKKSRNRRSFQGMLGRDIAMTAMGFIGASMAKNLFNRLTRER